MANENVKIEENEDEQGERTELPKGFISKEEWIAKGRDPEQWRDPKEWEARGKEINPILRDKNTKLEKEVSELKGDMQKILEFNQKQEDRIRQEERNKIFAEYELKKKEAFENEDIDALTKAEKDRDEKLKKTETTENKPKPQGEDPVFKEWKSNNPWYETDKELQNWSDTVGAGLVQGYMNSGKSWSEALDAVAQDIKKFHPDKFENPNREKPDAVEGDAGTKNRMKGNGAPKKIADISNAEERKTAQASFERIKASFATKNRKYTESDYMEAYNS